LEGWPRFSWSLGHCGGGGQKKQYRNHYDRSVKHDFAECNHWANTVAQRLKSRPKRQLARQQRNNVSETVNDQIEKQGEVRDD